MREPADLGIEILQGEELSERLPDHFKPLLRWIEVSWKDGVDLVREKERLFGFVYENNSEQTVEFRLLTALDLSAYREPPGRIEIFFGEGTGHATWKGLKQLHAMRAAQDIWGDTLVTPSVRELVDKAFKS